MDFLLVLLVGLVLLLSVVVVLLFGFARSLQNRLSNLLFQKGSLSVKYGKLTEQWIPFSEHFPYNAEKFRFLGNPVDGIVFDDEKIIFCEFKTATASLNENQKRVRELVQQKKVEWLEFKIR